MEVADRFVENRGEGRMFRTICWRVLFRFAKQLSSLGYGLGGFGGRVDVVDPLALGIRGSQEPDGQVALAVGERYPTGETKTPHHIFDTWVTVLEYLQSIHQRSGRSGEVSQI